MNDVTSNEKHATIAFSDGKFTVEDEDSRYGTCVLISEAKLEVDASLAV
jgi:hypothetical protein